MLFRFLLSSSILSLALIADIGHVQLLEDYKKTNPKALNFILEAEVIQSQKKMQTSGTPYEVFGTLGQAEDKYGIHRGLEYSFGVGKTYIMPHAAEIIESVVDKETKISLLQKEEALISDMYELLSFYHQACVQKETLSLYKQFTLQLEELHHKNERAYELGEISKKDLVLWHLQQRRINLEFEQKKSERLYIFRTLQSKFGSKLKIKNLTCNDLYEFELPQKNRSSEELLEMKRLILSRDKHELKSDEHWFHEVGVELSYDNELDVERYNASFSLPLEFSVTYHKSMAEMNQLKKLQDSNEITAFRVKKNKELQAAYIALAQAYSSYNKLEGPISEDAIELMDLTLTAYHSGESTAIEVITIQQYVMDILMQIQEQKVQFYSALFDYHTLSITGEEFR
ncbi:MAG: hypothetical protein U9R50_01045 [Campylobacterota bacterium]|nr:hypothetical protein [Campylobacterota bacterium]